MAVLRQTLQVDPDATVADLFGVTDALAVLRRAESGEASDDELNDADWTLVSRVAAALGRLGLDVPADTRLTTLSGGQQTRAGLAALVFAEPDFLLLDEPTNNLDRDGREAVIALLAGWRSGAIVVSHDRELLDTMDETVELTTLGATRYGGNWTAYRGIKAQELAAAERTLADAEKQIADAARTAQQTAERQARRNGAGKRQGLKGGTPRILLGLMKDRAEDTTGGNARLAEKLQKQASEAAEAARERIEVLQPLIVKLPATGLPAGKAVLRVDGLTAGYVPDRPIIRDLTFDWLINYVVKQHADKETLRLRWMAGDDHWALRAGWQLTAERVAKSPDGLDLPALLDRIESEMGAADPAAQWTMNSALAAIGINHPKLRKRAVAIGETLGVFRDYPCSKGCTSPFAPIWIAEMVKRQG